MQGKRMWAHDYTRPGFYMVTMVSARRQPLFGQCHSNRVDLSPEGEVVRRRWFEIPSFRPAVEASTLVVMPDHLHGILYVKERLEKPLGNVIRGYASGVTAELRKISRNPLLKVWEPGFHDRVIMSPDTLKAERAYIRDNPRRFCLKRANPDLFKRVNRLENTRLPRIEQWTGFGNLFLLDKPELIPIQVSRRVTESQIENSLSKVMKRLECGAVAVSPFISPGEKAIARLVMEQEHGALILMKHDGFPPLYKPCGKYFDLCAQGRLLVLSACVYTGRKQELTREQCLRMNRWVAEMCANNGAPQ